MPVLLFRLRNVPQEEADAVRTLLDEHHLPWYETKAGNWGIAMPAIWLNNEHDLVKARQLIDDYEQKRSIQQRKAYTEAMKRGEALTFIQHLKAHPFRIAGIVLFCLFILFAMINPFIKLIYQSQ